MTYQISPRAEARIAELVGETAGISASLINVRELDAALERHGADPQTWQDAMQGGYMPVEINVCQCGDEAAYDATYGPECQAELEAAAAAYRGTTTPTGAAYAAQMRDAGRGAQVA